MYEWQQSLATAHGADEVGGGQSRAAAVFAAKALLVSFMVSFHVCSLDSFFFLSPAGTITRSIVPIDWINFACSELTFVSLYEPLGGAPDFPDSCFQLSEKNFFGDVVIIHAMNMSEPSQAALAAKGRHAGDTST